MFIIALKFCDAKFHKMWATTNTNLQYSKMYCITKSNDTQLAQIQ